MKAKKIGKRTVSVGKGLKRDEALKKALSKCKGDFRAFSYNDKTGVATLI